MHEEVLRLQAEREARLREQTEIFVNMGFDEEELSIVESESGVDEVVPDMMLKE